MTTKADGTPDYRYKANREARKFANSDLSMSMARDFLRSHFAEQDAKAYLLRDFRSAFLEKEPKAIQRWFEMVDTKSDWGAYSTSGSGLPDLEWLTKDAPDIMGSMESGMEPDRYEEKWDALEEKHLIISSYEVEYLIKAFLDDAIQCESYHDSDLYEKNMTELNRHIQSALEVEADILADRAEQERLQVEKREEKRIDWEQKYGLCTRRSPYTDSFYKDHLPLSRNAYMKVRTEIKDGVMSPEGVYWLDYTDHKFVVPLRFMNEEELNYIKENPYQVNMDHPEDVDRELERRAGLSFGKKVFEFMFVRVQ